MGVRSLPVANGEGDPLAPLLSWAAGWARRSGVS